MLSLQVWHIHCSQVHHLSKSTLQKEIIELSKGHLNERLIETRTCKFIHITNHCFRSSSKQDDMMNAIIINIPNINLKSTPLRE